MPVLFTAPFCYNYIMSLSKSTFLAFALAFTFGFAQEYEPDVDSAWVAKQNGGRTELSNGESNEPAPACIGDGCDLSTSADQSTAENTTNVIQDTSNAVQDSTIQAATDSAKVAVASDEEDCTPADSLLPECQEGVDEEDNDDTYERYISENAEISRARKEGFSRSIKIGFRAAGGMNLLFGDKSDNWGPGFDVAAGIFAKLPVFTRALTVGAEVDFNYRRYNFETEIQYGEDYSSEDKAQIDMMLFEIPITFQYAPESEGLFFAIGFDLGLKLSSTSEYKQTVHSAKGTEKDKRKNTLPTAGVELGALVDLGYVFTNWFAIDIRVSRDFSNLLNQGAIAETEIMKSNLQSFHTSFGISFML